MNTSAMKKNRSRRKKLIIIITICSVLLILFAIYCYLFNHLNYPKMSSLKEYSSHSTIASKGLPLILDSIEENLNVLNVSLFNNKEKKIIVLWTTFFGKSDYLQEKYEESNCLEKNCVFTSNRTLLRESSAVIFHLRDLDLKDWPQYRSEDQRYILLHHESPPNTPHLLHKIEGQINWTATYRYGSDIFLSPTIRRRNQPNPWFKKDVNYAQNKSRMIVWLASNCRTDSNRETYVSELKNSITVDVFGKCGDRQCLPKMSSKCLEQISKDYRFILAFENSICRDYVTEKFFNPLEYDIIPVVFGGSDYRKIAPKKSFIDALSYTSPRHLARYLLYLSKNPNQYNQYFNWKRDYEQTVDPYVCQICRKLNNPLEPIKVWNNLNDWWFQEGKCTSWKPSKEF